MNNTDKLKFTSFFKELYDTEMKRRDDLDKILSFPMTVITILSGGVFSLIKQEPIKIDNLFFTDYVVFLFLIVFTICVMFCMFFMHKVYIGYKDKYYIPPRINDYYQNLSDENETSENFQLSIQNLYIESAQKAAKINEERKGFYDKLRYGMSLLLFIAVIIFILQIIKLIFYETIIPSF